MQLDTDFEWETDSQFNLTIHMQGTFKKIPLPKLPPEGVGVSGLANAAIVQIATLDGRRMDDGHTTAGGRWQLALSGLVRTALSSF